MLYIGNFSYNADTDSRKQVLVHANPAGVVAGLKIAALLTGAADAVLDEIEAIRPGQLTRLQDGIRASLRRFFRRVLERDPVVVAIVSEI